MAMVTITVPGGRWTRSDYVTQEILLIDYTLIQIQDWIVSVGSEIPQFISVGTPRFHTRDPRSDCQRRPQIPQLISVGTPRFLTLSAPGFLHVGISMSEPPRLREIHKNDDL